MKNKRYYFKLIILVFINTIPVSGSADPFMGEGKQGYINRCTSTSDMPGRSISEKKELCKCFANKLEEGYPKMMKSIKPTDSMSLAQQKMNKMAQKFIKPCMH